MNWFRHYFPNGLVQSFRQNPQYIAPLLALCLIAALWLASLPHSIAIANDPLPDPTGEFSGLLQLLDDSGEFVIAWHTWGVTHAPGYPLLGLVGNIGVRLLDPFGLYPATAAHLLSFFFALGALLCMGQPLARLDSSGIAVAVAYLLPAFGILVWLYAVVAEAYAFGLLLAFAMLSLAISVGQQPTTRKFLFLGVLFGLAIGHHRTLIFLAPALLVASWPATQLGWRVWVGAAVLAAATLLIYLYLPLVAWAGSPWVYGRSPTTWAGFTDAVFAREYSDRLAPPTTWPAIIAALDGRLRYLAQEMSHLGLLLGLLGFLPAFIQHQTRRLAGVFLLAFMGYLLAPVSQALLIRSYMMILVASFTLAGAWGLGVAALGYWRRWVSIVALFLTIVITLNTYRTHHDYILFHTKDEGGMHILEEAAALPGTTPVVGEIWGPRYFPLAYGKWVTGELAHIDLLDLRADLSGLPFPLPEVVWVNSSVLYATSLAQWSAKYGTAVALNSAGNHMIAIHQTPPIEPIVSQPLAAIDDLQLVAAQAQRESGNALAVQLVWQALQPPQQNYSVFVHVTDKEQILGPDDLLAQGDRLHPVAGFYPIINWRSGELVRDNYLITIPPHTTPRYVVVGLYTVDGAGQFVNYLSYKVAVSPLAE